MQEMGIGLSIGIALKGLASIDLCSSSFKKLKKTINDASNGVTHLNKNIKKIKMNKLEIDGLENSMKKFKSGIAEKVIAVGSIALPVKLAIDYEEAMADVKKVVDFDSNDELNDFGKQIAAMSRKIPLSAAELATITASGGQLGVAKENLLRFTEVAAKMGVAFDVGADQAGDGMGKLMNIFKTDIEGVTKLGDAINHLSDNSASKAREIVEVLKRIGGTAQTIGLTSTQASALASAFISLGKTPELAATSADTLMKKLGNIGDATEDARKALMEIGMDADYVMAGMSADPQKMIMRFLEATRKMPKESQLSLLTKIFGVGFSGDIALLVNGLDTYKKTLSDVADESSYLGSMNKEFENRSKTTSNALRLLKNSIVEVGINLGSLFLEPLSKVAGMISAFTNKIADFISRNELLSKVLGSVVAGFVGFGVMIPTIGYLFMGVRLWILKISTAYNYLVIAMGLTKKAFLMLTSTKLLNIKVGMRLYIENIRLALSNLRAAMSSRIHSASLALASLRLQSSIVFTVLYTNVLRGLTLAIQFAGRAFRALAVGIRVVGVALLTNPIGLILGGIALVAGLIIANWDKVKVWFAQFVGWISSVFEPPINYIKSLFEPLFNWLSEKFAWIGDMFGKIKGGVKIALDWVGLGDNTGATSSDSFGGGFDSGVSLFSSTFQQPQAVAMTSSGTAVNVNFSGNFNLMSNDGKFDLESFKNQITTAVQDALRRDEFNRRNRDIRG